MATLLANLKPSRWFTGLWLSTDFRKLWGSLTIVHFGGQVTFLALPLTAALMLNATPFEVGVLTALEALPYPLFGLFAGVLVDRARKLPVIIACDVGRGLAPGRDPRVRVAERALDAGALRRGLPHRVAHGDRLARLPGVHDRARGPREPRGGEREDRPRGLRGPAHGAGPRGRAHPMVHGAFRAALRRDLLLLLRVDASRHRARRHRRAQGRGEVDAKRNRGGPSRGVAQPHPPRDRVVHRPLAGVPPRVHRDRRALRGARARLLRGARGRALHGGGPGIVRRFRGDGAAQRALGHGPDDARGPRGNGSRVGRDRRAPPAPTGSPRSSSAWACSCSTSRG